MKTLSFFMGIVLLMSSCERNIQFHPNEVRPVREDLNQQNINSINSLPQKDTFKFIFTGDPQLAYDELKAFISHVNELDDISFVLLNGDLTEFGLDSEYNLLAEKLNKLKVPYVAAIGNHDMLSNGRLLFNKMFGPENFTFSYSGSLFIVMNTNSRETGFDGSLPDMNWLTQTLAKSHEYKNLFFVSHVPPFSADFDKNLEPAFSSAVSSMANARVSLHGHEHNFLYTTPYADKFPYVIAPAISKREYILLTVQGDDFIVEEKKF